MHDIQNIITERVDDIPLLLEQRQRRGLPTLLGEHFPPHGNWQGLSLGWVTTIGLSSIFSRGDPRLVPVAPWVAHRLWTLRATPGQAVERLDFPADRLDIVRRGLPDAPRWAACASALHQPTVRVYALSTARGHVARTSARASTRVSENGRLQFGQSKDYRPDLPQGKVRPAGLDPLGRPRATAVVSGERAAAPLSLPCLRRGQASVDRHGLLSVGDGKRAARETRALLAPQGDVSLGPLPPVPRAEGEWDAALEAVWRGEPSLSPVGREQADGTWEQSAAGDDSLVPRRLEAAGQLQSGPARRWVVRALRQAQAAERARCARGAKAIAPSEAWNQRGRGKRRLAEVAALRQAVVTMGQR